MSRIIKILSLLVLFSVNMKAFSQVQISPSTYTISGQSGYKVAKIGNVTGTSWVSEQNGLATFSSQSGDIWWNSDNFKFLYLQHAGDVEITAKLESLASVNSWSKLGLMARTSLQPNDKNFLVTLRPKDGSLVQYRTAAGANAVGAWRGHLPNTDLTAEELSIKQSVGNFKTPGWFRLIKKSDTFTFYSSIDGSCWDKRYEKKIPELATTAYYGIALSSGDTTVTATSTLRNLKIEPAHSNVNRNCSRATQDSWAAPTSWIIPTGKVDQNVEWRYTTNSPENNSQPVLCPISGLPHNHQEGSSDPSCINKTQPIQWTQLNFDNSGWQIGKMGFGRTFNPEINEKTGWDTSNIWLRKEFNLANQSQINDLVIWGKWSQGISIYLNGILAYSNYGWTANYGYRSIYPGARSKLTIGRNVIAVRVKANDWSKNSAGVYSSNPNFYGFLDVGLALSPLMKTVPMHVGTPAENSDIARIAEGLRELLSLHGTPGATFALGEDSRILGSWSYGYRTPQLTQPMPADAILRLASNDKPLTRSIIVALIERDKFNPNGLKPTSRYFEFLNRPNGLNLGITPPTGTAVGSGMNDVTIDDLIQHRAGIPEVPRGNNLDAMALTMGISALQWTPRHMVRWTYGLNRIQSDYSSNGHFLLRFLANEILKSEGSNIEEFLENEMGLSDIVISRKNYSERSARQAGYVITDFFHKDVWLDDFLSLDASAETYLQHSFDFYPFYSLNGTDYSGYHHRHNGGMDGSVSFYRVWDQNNKQRHLVVNLTKADATANAIESYVDNLQQKTACDWGQFSNPTATNGSFYIRNHWKPDQYFTGGGNFRSGPFETKPPLNDKWTIERISSSDFYIKRGSAYLFIDQLQKLQLGSLGSTNSTSSRWRLEAVNPGDPTSPLYRIRNVGFASHYINNQLQIDEDVNYPAYRVQATTIQSGWLSSVWTFCSN